MPAALLQLDPTIPVTTPHGKGHALGWLDYGAEGELFWIVADAKTGQVWIMPTSLVRMQANISMGRTHPEPPPRHKTQPGGSMSDDVPQETYPAEPTPPTPAPGSDPGVIPDEDDNIVDPDDDTFDTDDENKG